MTTDEKRPDDFSGFSEGDSDMSAGMFLAFQLRAEMWKAEYEAAGWWKRRWMDFEGWRYSIRDRVTEWLTETWWRFRWRLSKLWRKGR